MDALALISHDALDESSSVPLYCQLKHRILQLIATGTLGAGEALPTEQALCETFGLSRATVRRCYRDLVDEGYATRRRGRGSFVSLPEESGRLDTIYQQVSTSSAIGRSGARPGSRFLGIKVVPATGAAARSLGVADGAPLWEINRLRLADKNPVVHELAYVPQALCPRLDSANLESTSLYQCIAEESGGKRGPAHRRALAGHPGPAARDERGHRAGRPAARRDGLRHRRLQRAQGGGVRPASTPCEVAA